MLLEQGKFTGARRTDDDDGPVLKPPSQYIFPRMRPCIMHRNTRLRKTWPILIYASGITQPTHGQFFGTLLWSRKNILPNETWDKKMEIFLVPVRPIFL